MTRPATRLYFQLKYCERCGGLWLRLVGVATPYCPACAEFMDALPMRPPRNQDQRKPVRRASLPAVSALVACVLCFSFRLAWGGSL